MAKRSIIRLGEDDILRKHCRAVERFDDRLAALLDDMAETMYDANGAGLAAPQVGILKRAVVVDAGSGLIELVNPEIIRAEGARVGVESCLSVPDRCGTVERPFARWIISGRRGPPMVMSYCSGSTPLDASSRSARVQ